MNQPEFVYVTFIATTQQKLWAALTNGEFTQQYWSNPRAPVQQRLESEWAIGSPIRFYMGDSVTVSVSGRVLEYEPIKRLCYTFELPTDRQEQMDISRVGFNLEPLEGGVIKLTLVHDQVSSQEVANHFGEGWIPVLSGLKSYLETGKTLLWA